MAATKYQSHYIAALRALRFCVRQLTHAKAPSSQNRMECYWYWLNRFWHLLIRDQLTALVWRRLVEWTHRRHVRFRMRLAREESQNASAAVVVSAGV
jgi:hypothetical protein